MSPVPKEERDKPVDDNPECNNVENDDNLPDFIITLTSSESEAESDVDVEYDGYELLPQEVELFEYQEPVDLNEDETTPVEVLPSIHQSVPAELQDFIMPHIFPFTVPNPPTEDASSLLWNMGNPAAQMEMDKGQEERVRAAMKGFQLPSGSIPEWAKNIPDDKWKEHLLDKLQQLDTKDSDDKEHKPDDNPQNEDSSLK